MKTSLLKKQSGFGFIEMVVAVGIFSFTIVAAAGIFQAVVAGQRSAIAAENIQESFRYGLEIMSKETRSARRNITDCPSVGSGNIYMTENGASGEGEELFFENKNSQCAHYFLAGNRIYIARGTADSGALPITPSGVIVSSMKFRVNQEGSSQPSVTLLIAGYFQGQAIQKENIKIQTTISSRWYE